MGQDSSSFHRWLSKLRVGDDAAAQRFWESYFERLVVLARTKLRGSRQRMADGEDIAICAFESFCRGVRAGRYPQLSDKNDLWRLLVTITLNKALKVVRDQSRIKRGGKLHSLAGIDQQVALEHIAGREPSPEFALEISEQFEQLLGLLPSKEFVQLAIAKMEGQTNLEIASRWGKAERTVERKLRIIRETWIREINAGEEEIE